jgi:ABC-type branched-subunit amino acid transport system ATPase component/ABC-type branched-subunit amino acid transport system permease subunit
MTLAHLSIAGFELPVEVLVLGATIGITYGLLSVGLVLVYRTNKVINFAHGEIGAFGAALLGVAVQRWHLPYYLAAVLAIAAAAGTGAIAEVAVVRRLRDAPRLMSIVATLGVGQFLLFFAAVIAPATSAGFQFPSPPGLPEIQLGALKLTQAHVGMLVGGPILVLALSLFLNRTRAGLALRCAAANPEAARLAGISSARMSSLAWALAGAVSAFTAMLVFPARGFAGGESFGPGLLLRALTGAVVARMTSLPIALGAGIGLGVVEQLLLWNHPRAGLVEVALFVVIRVALLLQRGIGTRDDEKGSWAATQAFRPLPEAIAALPAVRHFPKVLAAVSLAVALLLPLAMSNSSAVKLTQIVAFAVVGLSVAVVTGLGGQLSLGQFAVAGIGAVVSFHVSSRAGSFPLAFAYAGVAGAVASLLIGIPALRIKGLLLTVTTLGFALVTTSWLLQQSWALGGGVEPGRPIIFGTALDTGRQYYYVALAVLVVAMLLAWNVRRGGFGRLLIAVRDNEDGARAFTVPARTVKLQGFAIAGFVAGLGGAAYGHLAANLGTSLFPTEANIEVVAMAVIGGMSLLAGPIIGALYIIGIPAFLPLDAAGLAATQLGWLLLVLYLPGGVAQGLEPLRTRLAHAVARRHGIDPAAAEPPASAARGIAAVASRNGHRVRHGTVALEAAGLGKSFGGVEAVRDVDLEVRHGEIVGLIGPNGAGKTTTFELLGGFTRADRGRVRFDGEDITDESPEQRAQRGLIRSFQDAALFPTMSVLDAAKLSFERRDPTSAVRSCLGFTGQERDKDRRARELIGAMGLDAYRHRTIQELSTGTRRITEIACLIALQPTLLLLDEPSSGIAQRETEALGELLLDIHLELGVSMLVIEHDIPLIMGLADRIVAMDAGAVIASGTPDEVRRDPLVVEAYLGGSVVAIERSTTKTKALAR